MRNTADAHLDCVVDAIQNYLSRHPGAADSEPGIAQWWLRELQYDDGTTPTAEEVRQALIVLQTRGVVEELDLPGVGRLWRGRKE